ncbi:MAG: CarD family transcriptional regulator [Clostridia bacterium]|nr:CarD family transcriptional regulator [Clostridia bacterium]
MYHVGDRVVHPLHGAGTISAITQRKTDGNLRAYYVLSLLSGNLRLLVPCGTCERIGVRPVMTAAAADALLASFSRIKAEDPPGWNRRYRENMLRIRTGDPAQVAQVIRGLALRERERQLSAGERKMLVSAKMILASELALVKEIPLPAAAALLEPLGEP